MKKMNRSRFFQPKIIMAIFVLAALLALSVSLALANSVPPQGANIVRSLEPRSKAQNFACTAGATGYCEVIYWNWLLNQAESIQNCGEAECYLRVEYRW